MLENCCCSSISSCYRHAVQNVEWNGLRYSLWNCKVGMGELIKSHTYNFLHTNLVWESDSRAEESWNTNTSYKATTCTALTLMLYIGVVNGQKVGEPVRMCLSLSCLPSCSSPRNSTASMTVAQDAGGWIRSNQVSSISRRHLWGSCSYFSAMPARVPFGISRRTPIIFHLSATLW